MGEPGSEIYPEVALLENEPVIKKHRYSAFFGTYLDIILRDKGIETVVIVGLTTAVFLLKRHNVQRI